MSGFGGSGGNFGAPSFATPSGSSSSASNNHQQFPSQQQRIAQPMFGSSTNTSFGSASSAGNGMAFGSSPHVNPFGGASAFATPQQNQQPQPASSSSFPFSPSPLTFGNNRQDTGFASSLSNPFGAAPSTASTTTFGMSSSIATPFGSAMNQSSQQQQHTSMTAAPSSAAPFFMSQQPVSFANTAANSAVSFGVSSNVMAFPIGSSFATSSFTNQQQQQNLDMASSPTPYGDEVDMAADDAPYAPMFPFGQQSLAQAQPASNTWEQPRQQQLAPALNATAPVFTPFGRAPRMRQDEQSDDEGPSRDDERNNRSADNGELARLKAKIEEKKRRLLEQTRKKEHASEDSSSPPPTISTPQATTLAQRNAVRFAQANANHDNDDDNAPAASLANAAPAASTTASGIAATEREDLQNAVSLVGTCPFMCPEEELRRREAEGDIQLLEIPRPGTLHPQGWTLRETAVKRFRRSAADYKLDVPEWIRPPDVLESVMGYLEEWVMERDRQGGDPRFPQGGVPPSLDVYQFIWDRTRMIRKDFILQNYVGTGGNCDARAVRCHERIARWHAMCEHQLSHIPDFVKAQSQQNISELGQTLKSLNQFYDDSLKRSTVEVPDEVGQETRTDVNGFSHGCHYDIVQGCNPIDYDGTLLDNTADEENRVVGRYAVKRPDHGTAEPEMRGLYILLTIDNDGGMEVLKYAGRLYSEQPDVYHSAPVQLAMKVYMARREYNYARFFAILRSPDTPYLYACLMFKHVELMRKSAFRIMSKTYGARGKDNEHIYDAYPLKSLVRLLCYESVDEAKKACEHYGITVKAAKNQSSDGTVVEEIIYWRHSIFREPTDHEKGTVIPLSPRKMVVSIENKLRGATRLAIVRGQASGGSLSRHPIRPSDSPTLSLQNPVSETGDRTVEFVDLGTEEESHTRADVETDQDDAHEKAKLEAEARARRADEEKAHQEAEARIREQEEAARIAEAARRNAEVKAMREKEDQARRAAEEAEIARRMAEADMKRRAEELAAEQARLDAEEQIKRDEAERHRQESEAQARREREEIARRKAAEQARLEAAEKCRQQEARDREEKQWEAKRFFATKQLILRRWLQQVPGHILDDNESKKRQDMRSPIAILQQQKESFLPQYDFRNYASAELDLRRSIEMCLNVEGQLPIAHWAREAIAKSVGDYPPTVLLTIGVLIPPSADEGLNRLMHTWIASRLRDDHSVAIGLDVRIVVKDVRAMTNQAVDAIFALDLERSGVIAEALDNDMDASPQAVVLKIFPDGEVLSEKAVVVSCFDLRPESLEKALQACALDIVLQLSRMAHVSIERFSLSSICCSLAQTMVERAHNIERREDFLIQVKIGLSALVDYLDEIAAFQDNRTRWPPTDFSVGGRVLDYFVNGQELSLDWLSSLRRESTAPMVGDLVDCLAGSVEDTVNTLLSDAPGFIRLQSQIIIHERNYRSALLIAFQWRRDNTQEPPSVFVPRGMLAEILNETVRRALVLIAAQYPAVRSTRIGDLLFSSQLIDVQPTDFRECDADHLSGNGAGHVSAENDEERQDAYIMDTVYEVADRSKRPLDIGVQTATSPPTKELNRSSKKARRLNPDTAVSVEVRESRKFTKKLEAYLLGTITSDVFVGMQPLSSYLRGAPGLNGTNGSN